MFLLKQKASVDLVCPAEEIRTKEMHMWVERVSGCNRENVYIYDRSIGAWSSPIDRASFDLDCPRSSIVTNIVDGRSVGAAGCGRKAVYVLTPMGPRDGLEAWGAVPHGWVADVVSDEAKPPSR